LPNNQLNNEPFIINQPILPIKNTEIITNIEPETTVANNHIISQPV
jgi:hypothetical protein